MKSKKITIGILAHVDAGKTTLSEAMLYLAGEIRKPGRVDRGDTFLDDNLIERNRGITIFSRQARMHIAEGDAEVTLIDTPGHVDFSAEMERSLSVLDYALLVVSGSEGVQAHTRTLCRMLSERDIPVFIFVNKMDIAVRERESMIAELTEELGVNAVDFSGAGSRSEEFTDAVTLFSPQLAETVLENGEDALSDGQIADAVKKRELSPCFFGSALKLEGVEELLEAFGRYTKEPEYGSEFGARIYKVANAEDGERLCFLKITGGELHVRDKIKTGTADGAEIKINQIRMYSGSRCVNVESAAAGTVCAVTGLRGALPGDALGAEKPAAGTSVRPFMVYSVKGPEGMDPYHLMEDLKVLAEEDPALNASWDRGGNGINIRLMGQVQLEVLQAVIKDRFGYNVSFGQGSVLCLETITGTYEGVGHFEPLRHYAEVHLILEPGERGSGIVITSDVPEDELAVNWQRLILTHLEEKEHTGVLTGSPLTDVRITLAAGRAHDKHTVGGDFREATYRAVRNALMQALREDCVVLLEPWCEYVIELPSQHVGRAMTDIRQMGGTQDGLEQSGDKAVLRGRVPAVEISSYQTVLTSYSSGEGRIMVTPCGYDVCHNSGEVIEESGYDPEHDTENPADSVFVNHSGSDIVRWDEIAEHMHIGSVLKSRERRGSYFSPDSAASSFRRFESDLYGAEGQAGNDGHKGKAVDVREQARRRAAAEKELKMIFEKTYGQAQTGRRIEKTEADYRSKKASKAGLTDEEAARNAERNLEIRAKHERKSDQNDSRPAMILIDGYNLIFADDYLKELSKMDMGSARDQLIEKLSNYAGYTGFEVNVIFDAYKVGMGTGHEEEVNGVRVIFTAEDEPADIRIGKMTGSIKDRQIYAVSSDMLVQQDAWGHGALRISSREFLDMLEHTEEEIRSRLNSRQI